MHCDPGDLATAFVAAWNRHDMPAIAALFEEQARFVNVVGMFWRSRAAIEEAHAHTHAHIFKNSTLTLEAVEQTALAPDVVGVHAHWRLEGHLGPEGRPESPRNGVMLLIARRAPPAAGWHVAVAQNTDAIPDVITIPQLT